MAREPFLTVDGFDFVGSPEIDDVTNKLLGVHLITDAKSTVWLDPHFKEIQEKVDGILKSTTNMITCGADCLNSPVVLVISHSDRQPTQYFIYTVASGAIVGLGGTHPAIKPAQMGMRDFYHYPARDGLSIPAYVTMPPGKASGPLPTVVLVHGGPYLRGASWEWESEAQFLASRGYVVIQPEFRGSTGFGSAHFHAGLKKWGQSMQDDLADAADWAIKKGWADPKRIAIMGASYGGYATLMGLIKNPDIFRCGVEWAGVTDVNMWLNDSDSDLSQNTLNYDLKTLVGDPVADAAMFKENSPLANAAKLTQPILLAHGVQDRRVPIDQATAFHSAVSKTNSHVEWIVYTNEGHGWRHQDDRIDFWKHVETFLDKNL
jgi:dipeptidyl aminopeptidase/acylaminoacyl peptidase